MKPVEFYKESLDDFYPCYSGNLVKVVYCSLLDGRYCISVSGQDDYSMTKISPDFLTTELYDILEQDYITKRFLSLAGFNS